MSRNKKQPYTLAQRYYNLTDFQLRCGENEEEILSIGRDLERKLGAAEALRGDIDRTLKVISMIDDKRIIEVAARLHTIIKSFDEQYYHKD